MIKRFTILALLAAFIASEADAQNRKYRRRGALFGGLAGAAIGAAIGDKGDNETAGALIGGAVGAIAGGKIGSQKDQRIEHNRIYHSGHYGHPQGGYYYAPQTRYRQGYYPSQAPPYPTPIHPHEQTIIVPDGTVVRPIVPEDIVTMVRSGLSEPMIIEQIRLNGVMHRLTINDVIRLHQLGVSEPIIVAMQRAAPVATPSGEVIVEPTQSYRAPTRSNSPSGPAIVAPSNTR